MLNDQQVSHYKDNGYLILDNVLSKSEIDLIRNEIPDCINKPGIINVFESDGESIRSIMSYHNKNEVLDKYTRYNRIVKAVEKITTTPVYVSQSKINLKRGTVGEKWDFHRGLTFWNLLDGIQEDKMISVFICLTDQTIENGAVFILKESHRNVDLDLIREESTILGGREQDTASDLSIQIKQEYLEKYSNDYKKEYLTAKAGDVIFMHPCLLHASENNQTQESRDLMITVYNPVNNLPTKHDRPSYLCEPFEGPISVYEEK